MPTHGREVGSIIETALEAIAGGGEDAEVRYQRALTELRHQPEPVSQELAATYRSLNEDQYMQRWGMVQLLTDLRTAGSVPALEDVLQQPIPGEQAVDPAHGFSTLGEELMIRTAAVEALARLVSDGDRSAGEVLLKHIQHDAPSIRRAVVRAILGTADHELAGRVREALARPGRMDAGGTAQGETE